MFCSLSIIIVNYENVHNSPVSSGHESLLYSLFLNSSDENASELQYRDGRRTIQALRGVTCL